MKRIKAQIILLAACSVCFSCTDTDVAGGHAVTGDKVRISLEVSAPALTGNALTRTVTSADESSISGDFVVFAFDEGGTLMWELVTGDTNTSTNLKGSDGYDNNSSTASVTWHADASAGGGRLYIEADEYDGPVKLLVLANVDTATARSLELTPGTSAKEDVVEALSVYDFAVDDDLEYIPMAGEVELADGIQLGSSGELKLRRSLARITVSFEWNDDYYHDSDLATGNIENIAYSTAKCFVPEKVVAAYVNTYATVYSPAEGSPAVSAREDNTPHNVIAAVPAPVYDSGSNTFGTSVDIYVPETVNTKKGAFDGSPSTPNEDARISVLVYGTFYETDAAGDPDNGIFKCWYRLDFIPATGGTDEIDCLLRNNLYHFELVNVSKRGSNGEMAGYFYALGMSQPDNYRQNNDGVGSLVVIDDDNILSVTADYDNVDDDGVPYYIGVSSTEVEIPRTQDAVARVEVVTNIAGEYLEENGWTVDFSSIPADGDGIGATTAFSFIYDSDAQTMWIWLDHPELVETGATYTYYICAGNIRKRMKITITEGTYEDTD